METSPALTAPDADNDVSLKRSSKRIAPKTKTPLLMKTWQAAILAFLIVAICHLADAIARRQVPFGSATFNLDDEWRQIIPFFDQFGNILRGHSISDLFYNWTIGLGSNFLPDYATYLSGPWSLFAGFVPHTATDIAIWTATTLNFSLAAAAMVYYLAHVRPATSRLGYLVLATIGASYGLCGWAIVDGSFFFPWTYGMISVPLLALVGEWALEGKHFTWSVICVGLCWYSNYYTAYMATIAAVLLFVMRIAAGGFSWRQSLQGLGRFALRGGLGVALTMPILYPTYQSLKYSVPGTATQVTNTILDYAYWFLPTPAQTCCPPGIALLVFPMLCAMAMPFVSGLSKRVRAVYCTGFVLVFASMIYLPTMIAWHVFTAPNGSWFREAFCIAAIFATVSWLSWTGIERKPSVWPFWGAHVVFYGAIYIGLSKIFNYRPGYNHAFAISTKLAMAGWFIVLAIATIVALWGLARRYPKVMTTCFALVLVLATLGEGAIGVYISHRRMEKFYNPLAWHDSRVAIAKFREALDHRAKDDPGWPQTRTFFEYPVQMSAASIFNDSDLAYLSSVSDTDMADAMRSLVPYYRWYGRIFNGTRDEGLSTLLGASGTVHTNNDDTSDILELDYHSHPAMPVARVMETNNIGKTSDSVFETRNFLLEKPAYSLATVSYKVAPYRSYYSSSAIKKMESTTLTEKTRVTTGAESKLVYVTMSCAEGLEARYRNPKASVYSSMVDDAGLTTLIYDENRHLTEEGLKSPSKTDKTGGTIKYTVSRDGFIDLDPNDFGCYNPEVLHEQAKSARTPDSVTLQGSTIKLGFNEPTSGVAVVATATTRGWSCTVDGREASIGRTGGLFSVALDNSREVSCHYRTPGFLTGLALGGASLVVTVAISSLLWWRRRKQHRPRRSLRTS